MHSQAPHSNCATACAIESVNVVAAVGEGERAPRHIQLSNGEVCF